MTHVTRATISGFDRLFNDIFEEFKIPQIRQSYEGFPVSNIKVHKETENLQIEIAVTGYDPDDIKVSIDGKTLIVRSNVKEDEEDDSYVYITRRIRKKTSFERKWQLPRDLLIDKAEVNIKNGLLTVSIPYDSERSYEKPLEVKKS